MDAHKAEVLNIIQETLRGMTVGLLAMQPTQAARVSAAMQAFAEADGISPEASAMLLNLAEGVAVLAAAQAPRN
ncbi:MAG TPA: hypothetical protein VNV16_12420 [Methylibium sp.]|nr:hypothetical protein [Methylibium sp.]